jgi:hypothetical protein
MSKNVLPSWTPAPANDLQRSNTKGISYSNTHALKNSADSDSHMLVGFQVIFGNVQKDFTKLDT